MQGDEKRIVWIILSVILICALCLLGACAKNDEKSDSGKTEDTAAAGTESAVSSTGYDT